MADITNLGPTRALYQHRAELHEHPTKVLAVSPVTALQESDLTLFKSQTEGDHVVVTEETIFHAQGGGQPSDSGVMIPKGTSNGGGGGGGYGEECGSFEVHLVRRSNNGRILHYGRFNPEGKVSFDKDSTVQQIIDSKKRDSHSRIHTAGHLLGLVVRQLADLIPNVTETKGQHYPDSAFVEFQGLIDGKYKDTIQDRVDELVKQPLPVTVRWLNEQETREKCLQVPDGFDFASGELMRVVEIAGLGAYPCGGTHVIDTGQIGAVKVKKISRQKGRSKISYSVE